jgi:DNA-binding protein HU-beta
MNKSELINAIAESAELQQAKAADALNATLDAIKDALSKGDSVTLVGFGTFLVRERSARTGRSPKTGESIQISASKAPAFKPGKSFKDSLNKIG